MDFEVDQATRELVDKVSRFLTSQVYPAEPELARHPDGDWTTPAVVARLRDRAREQGLWNLFLTGHAGGFGTGLTNLQYAPVAELTGRSPWLAPEAMNCSAPDTGNMELLALFGTPQQQARWLEPLLDARIRSAFCMTEPDVASSDATNLGCRIERDGDEYVITGRKWWSTGAMNPRCALFVLLGRTDPAAPVHRQQSIVLVPRAAAGVSVVRPLRVFGFDDAGHGGHAEVHFDRVRVPVTNLLGGEGDGFALAQARLGPGRVHHCMRLIGMAERALELLCRRVVERSTFGRPLAEHGMVEHWIAQSRVRIEQARLLVLKTAWMIDTAGNAAARTEIQEIKIVVPQTVEWILDKAIQAHGGAGVSQDLPLAGLWTAARSLRLADGPDEVHERSLARRELRRYTDPAPPRSPAGA
jgi:acyl-CoA dehydrogenase